MVGASDKQDRGQVNFLCVKWRLEVREVSAWKIMRLQTWNNLKDLRLKFLILTWSLLPREVVPENGKMSLRYKIQSQKKGSVE